jgi:proline dehydrogenase
MALPPLATRFIAGETIDSALRAVTELNAAGMSATLDYLGEDVRRERDANATREHYILILDALARSGARANVSLKLSAFGLLIDEMLAYRNVLPILERAAAHTDPFVRIDMEGSALTDATLRVFERLYADRQNVGPVLQAYLRRTPDDVERMIALGARVRLCKGAYKEPAALAYRSMNEIRREYLRCAQALLSRGNYPGIATHDEVLIAAVKMYARDMRISNDRYEFQLLYGVRPTLQRSLADEGYSVRIYVPFGTRWARYFYRRVSERRENFIFALRSLIWK